MPSKVAKTSGTGGKANVRARNYLRAKDIVNRLVGDTIKLQYEIL